MALDARGIISIVEIILYLPILVISALLALRNGFTKKAGWIFLIILSIIRLIGGVTHILSQENPTSISLRVIFNIMESSGLSPLLVATLGFLGTTAQHTLDNIPMLPKGLKVLGFVGAGALALAVFGGIMGAKATSQSGLGTADTLRHASALLFLALYVCIVALTIFFWKNRQSILKYRRRLRLGIVAALPLLFVRVLYGLLSSFAPTSVTFVSGHQVPLPPSTDGLGIFASSSPYWGIYLVMSVIAEYAVVLIFVGIGLVTPLGQDIVDYEKTHLGRDSSEALAMPVQQPYDVGRYPQQY
ncbi:hypothetical protein L227DRAFT_610462 [Lentinus tigrinus ALCF2SS1-6]|uniref:DUF7702 domain-containing protein n=1 Tax=Lentinus tigrinus ALCF2SS1-6 TaxID=1328759 RepID=A0A5C2SCP4_9APHY|nr:hypothetical protein L227DRAFT_610462 [Lentinus tigrinus ALCF2SS1-6]